MPRPQIDPRLLLALLGEGGKPSLPKMRYLGMPGSRGISPFEDPALSGPRPMPQMRQIEGGPAETSGSSNPRIAAQYTAGGFRKFPPIGELPLPVGVKDILGEYVGAAGRRSGLVGPGAASLAASWALDQAMTPHQPDPGWTSQLEGLPQGMGHLRMRDMKDQALIRAASGGGGPTSNAPGPPMRANSGATGMGLPPLPSTSAPGATAPSMVKAPARRGGRGISTLPPPGAPPQGPGTAQAPPVGRQFGPDEPPMFGPGLPGGPIAKPMDFASPTASMSPLMGGGSPFRSQGSSMAMNAPPSQGPLTGEQRQMHNPPPWAPGMFASALQGGRTPPPYGLPNARAGGGPMLPESPLATMSQRPPTTGSGMIQPGTFNAGSGSGAPGAEALIGHGQRPLDISDQRDRFESMNSDIAPLLGEPPSQTGTGGATAGMRMPARGRLPRQPAMPGLAGLKKQITLKPVAPTAKKPRRGAR